MSWTKGKYLGQPPTIRFGHTSTAIGPHLLIFGGWEFTKAQNEIIVLRECTNRSEEQQAGQDMMGEPAYDEDGMPIAGYAGDMSGEQQYMEDPNQQQDYGHEQ